MKLISLKKGPHYSSTHFRGIFFSLVGKKFPQWKNRAAKTFFSCLDFRSFYLTGTFFYFWRSIFHCLGQWFFQGQSSDITPIPQGFLGGRHCQYESFQDKPAFVNHHQSFLFSRLLKPLLRPYKPTGQPTIESLLTDLKNFIRWLGKFSRFKILFNRKHSHDFIEPRIREPHLPRVRSNFPP